MMKIFFPILFVLLLSGCIGGGSDDGETHKSSMTTSTIVDTVSPDKLDCMAMSNLTAKDICLYNKAKVTKDRKLCESIGFKHFKSRCRAEIDVDQTICKGIGDVYHRDNCYRNIANSIGNVTICNSIVEYKIHDECIYTILKYKKPNPFRCLDLKNVVLKDECLLYHFDLGLINSNLCFMIDNPQLELECNETYLYPYLNSSN